MENLVLDCCLGTLLAMPALAATAESSLRFVDSGAVDTKTSEDRSDLLKSGVNLQKYGLPIHEISSSVSDSAIAELQEGGVERESYLRRVIALVDSGLSQSTQQSEQNNGSTRQSARGQDLGENRRRTIEEVVVTAQKREERALDVPVPVMSISADKLVDADLMRIQDYYSRVPGLNFTPGFQGEAIVSIRGITAGVGLNPTVGVTVDDIPYGSSTGLGGGYTVPDIDPSDLASVEVLRGPQGTLYGASSIGGLIKYVTLDPKMDSMSGTVQAGVSSVDNGDELGYSARGTLNMPLGDTVAVRASGFTRRDPGYIDNVQTGERAVNSGDADGGRLSVLWRPSDRLSVKLAALLQESETNGSSYGQLQPGSEDLQQSVMRGTGSFSSDHNIYSASISTKIGAADLTSLTGYSVREFRGVLDYGPSAPIFFGVPGAYRVDDRRTTKFSQEVRLSSPVGGRIDWLVGAFYTDEDTSSVQDVVAANPATGAAVDTLIRFPFPTTLQEYAAFANLTLQATERFDIQVGGRESWLRQKSLTASLTGSLFGGAEIVQPGFGSEADAFTYLVTPRFKVSPDLMLYARLASGYRAGGGSEAVNPVLGFPTEYKPDKTQNYEIGAKGRLFNGALLVDTSAFYIDWKDIQINLCSGGFCYTGNVGRAKSQGVELSLEAAPINGLTVAGWVTWNDSVLTEDFPPESAAAGAYANSGDRLPFSSRISANLSLDQQILITNNLTGILGAAVSYVGDRAGSFRTSSQVPRALYPSYVQIDLRAGIDYESWTINAFLKNAANKRGVIAGDPVLDDTQIYYIQPRTVGLSVAKAF